MDVASESHVWITFCGRRDAKGRPENVHTGSKKVVLSTSRPNSTYYGRPLPNRFYLYWASTYHNLHSNKMNFLYKWDTKRTWMSHETNFEYLFINVSSDKYYYSMTMLGDINMHCSIILQLFIGLKLERCPDALKWVLFTYSLSQTKRFLQVICRISCINVLNR